jgi:hypothetical protein
MLDGGQKSATGRCPTCRQLLTLSGGPETERVECPRCHQRALAAELFDTETPLAAIAVPAGGEAGQTLVAIGSEPAPAAFEVVEPAASDEPRTHLLLDAQDVREEPPTGVGLAQLAARAPAMENGAAPDEQRTQLMLGGAGRQLGGAGRQLGGAGRHVDNQPTHLMLGGAGRHADNQPTQLMLARAPREEAAAQSAPATPSHVPVASDEARTHLLLQPVDVKEEGSTFLARGPATLGRVAPRLLRFAVWVADLMHRRWLATFTVFAGVGLGAPSMDYLLDEQGAALSLVASSVVCFCMSVFGAAWLAHLKDDEGAWHVGVLTTRLKSRARLALEDVHAFDQSPRYLKLLIAGQAIAALGLTCLTGASMGTLLCRVAAAADAPGVLTFLGGLILLIGLTLLRKARSLGPRAAPGPEELGESLSAAAQLPPIIDLAEALPRSFIGGYTLLHRSLVVLSQWRAGPWPDEAGYQLALERHFQRELPASRVERNKWLGRSRGAGVAHIVIDNLLLIEVKHGFQKTSAERAVADMNDYARTWPFKPMILAVFDAPREALFESPATAPLIDLHQRLPLLTARMPIRRW